MKKIIIVQPSLRKQSYTHTVCDLVIKECAKRNDLEVQYIDLRERELEFCDGRDISKYNADLQGDYTSIKGSDIVIM
jgi:NAD(P)H-dependent FMN reductase